MIRFAAVVLALLLAGCASQQSITLLPRGTGPQGTGVIDRVHNMLTVDLDGRQYQGTMQLQSASSTSFGPFGPRTSSTTSNQASSLLLGAAGGQVRCDFGWNQLMTEATGVCVDYNNVTYDMLIRQ
jgi:hypothetical protein